MKKKKEPEASRPVAPDWKIIAGVLLAVVILILILTGKITPSKINIFGVELDFVNPTSTQIAAMSATPIPPTLTSAPTEIISPTDTLVPAAIASKTPTSSFVKYFDNFDHGVDSTVWKVDLNDWLGTNGMVSAAQIYKGAMMFIGDASWQDYKISVNTSSSNGERTSYVAAIYVRYQDKDNYVQFLFNCNFPASSAIWKYKQNGNVTEINTTKRELSTCKLEPYIIKLSVQGTKYDAVIDGEETTFTLDIFKSGMVGLYSDENGGNASAAFDNFVIEP